MTESNHGMSDLTMDGVSPKCGSLVSPFFGKFLAALSLAMVSLAALSLVGCAPVSTDNSGSQSFRVLLLNPATDTYQFQTVVLHTYEQPDKLRGTHATILVDPQVTNSAFGVSIDSPEPIGRYSREGSVWTPADYTTLQATTIYAHAERLAAIDRALGLGEMLKTPAKIGIRSRLTEAGSRSGLLIYNNAIFDGRWDTLFIVPFDRPDLPISLNAGVLAHEHFHRIFQNTALRSAKAKFGACAMAPSSDDHAESGFVEEPNALVSSTGPKAFNQVLLRSMNEGFADFWGWSYSRDERFIARSLGEAEYQARRLDGPSDPLPDAATIRSKVESRANEREQVMFAYRNGTRYSRFLRSLVETAVQAGVSRDEAVEEVRRALVSSVFAIGAFGASSPNVWTESELDPEIIVAPMTKVLLKSKVMGAGSAVSKKICSRLREVSSRSSTLSAIDAECSVSMEGR